MEIGSVEQAIDGVQQFVLAFDVWDEVFRQLMKVSKSDAVFLIVLMIECAELYGVVIDGFKEVVHKITSQL